jgi:signal transduction histidine kinase
VADTGEGIPADQVARLFQRFQQVDENEERRKIGTGLGLAISRQLVEMHGGRIWVESAPGQGADFVFALPVNK